MMTIGVARPPPAIVILVVSPFAATRGASVTIAAATNMRAIVFFIA